MKVITFRHTGVAPNGNVKGGGAVHTEPMVLMSSGEGCGATGCHCSDGYWITIGKPRTKSGIVEGIRVVFDNKAEMDKFFKNHELIGAIK